VQTTVKAGLQIFILGLYHIKIPFSSPKCNQLFRVCCECVIKLGKISLKKFFLQFFVRFILPDIQPTNKQTEAVDDVLEFRRSPFYWQFTSGTECIIFVVIMLIFVCRGDCVHKAGDECDT